MQLPERLSSADVSELKKMSDQDAQKELDLQQQLDAVKKDLQAAKDSLAAVPTAGGDVGRDRAVLEGVEYEILWRSTVKDLVWEGFKKGHLDENHTGIVISKIGG
jgi:hypothetical protein